MIFEKKSFKITTILPRFFAVWRLLFMLINYKFNKNLLRLISLIDFEKGREKLRLARQRK